MPSDDAIFAPIDEVVVGEPEGALRVEFGVVELPATLEVHDGPCLRPIGEGDVHAEGIAPYDLGACAEPAQVAGVGVPGMPGVGPVRGDSRFFRGVDAEVDPWKEPGLALPRVQLVEEVGDEALRFAAQTAGAALEALDHGPSAVSAQDHRQRGVGVEDHAEVVGSLHHAEHGRALGQRASKRRRGGQRPVEVVVVAASRGRGELAQSQWPHRFAKPRRVQLPGDGSRAQLGDERLCAFGVRRPRRQGS